MIRKFFLCAVTVLWLGTAAGAEKLFYITEPEGEALMASAELRGPYFKLASYLEVEQVLTFCGPASIVSVLNSLDIERPQPVQYYPWAIWTQSGIFTPANQAVKAYAMVEHEGLILEELATFFRNLGTRAEYAHADAFDVPQLRNVIKASLADPGKRFVANYSRKPIGQNGDGHISPVAAYNGKSDRVLVLDVAKYKYPPVWMTVADLYAGMQAVDAGSGKPRGFVVVSK
ncbi:MAG: phytochelatin synthase family protein [Burkholderiaceae bacterium]|nr:phytochelatin synthase family protein [Burkholderiaceae bacterium]